MSYWMLFQHTQDAAVDTPLGVHVSQENVNAMCVFSSDEKAFAAKTRAPGASDYYVEAAQPDDVAALAVMHGIDVVALDPWVAKKTTLFRTVDAAEGLARLHAGE
jgi:hypothetical protein